MYSEEQKTLYPETSSFFLPSGEEHYFIYTTNDPDQPISGGIVYKTPELLECLYSGEVQMYSEGDTFFVDGEFFGTDSGDYIKLGYWGMEVLEFHPFIATPAQVERQSALVASFK